MAALFIGPSRCKQQHHSVHDFQEQQSGVYSHSPKKERAASHKHDLQPVRKFLYHNANIMHVSQGISVL